MRERIFFNKISLSTFWFRIHDSIIRPYRAAIFADGRFILIHILLQLICRERDRKKKKRDEERDVILATTIVA